MKINTLFIELNKKYGNLNWWPVDKKYHENNNSDYRFEIIIGTILTQNTSWSNVEKALNNLKAKNIFNINKIESTPVEVISKLIKPSGYYNQKANSLKIISSYFTSEYNSKLDNFFKGELKEIRNKLLDIKGIGPETADSILLYAGNHPIFVVDAYTKRLCKRLPIKVKLSYENIQDYFHSELKTIYKNPEIVRVYNQLHALIVIFAKEICKKKPNCSNCPISKYCEKLF